VLTILSWVAFVFGMLGMWLAPKTPVGWAITSAGTLFWVFYAFNTEQYALLFSAIVWFIIEASNYFRSRKISENIQNQFRDQEPRC